jgi:hypothetical protein
MTRETRTTDRSRGPHASFVGLATVIACLVTGCSSQASDPGSSLTEIVVPADEGPAPPAGTTCVGACPRGQICVAEKCRYRVSSAAGETLATAGLGQLAVGDHAGALESFDQAVAAFQGAEAPIPPEVLCGAAKAALRLASDAETREAAAQRSDACFRGSLPSDPLRAEVQTALSRLRFDGLDMAAFDDETPRERFFTLEPTRPTMDAIEIALSFGESEEPGFEELTAQLRAEASQRAIAECFIADWESRHERSVRGDFLLKLRTQMRDMGDYDVYEPQIEVVQAQAEAGAEAGFSACVTAALATALAEEKPRMRRSISGWQEPFEVAVRVQ